jgi:hypothetical protein
MYCAANMAASMEARQSALLCQRHVIVLSRLAFVWSKVTSKRRPDE